MRREVMNYYIHFGKLYQKKTSQQETCLCYIKGPFYSTNKTIISSKDNSILKAEIVQKKKDGKLDSRKYLLTDEADHIVAEGQLEYAEGADPWPVCHAPRVDRLLIKMDDSSYELKMLNSQNFVMEDQQKYSVMEIIHNDIGGGWNTVIHRDFDSSVVMGIFVFSRYLDKENEFIVV